MHPYYSKQCIQSIVFHAFIHIIPSDAFKAFYSMHPSISFQEMHSKHCIPCIQSYHSKQCILSIVFHVCIHIIPINAFKALHSMHASKNRVYMGPGHNASPNRGHNTMWTCMDTSLHPALCTCLSTSNLISGGFMCVHAWMAVFLKDSHLS